MESERYRLTVLFLKTFFRSWALSVKLHTVSLRELVSCRAPQVDLIAHSSL